MPKTMLHKFLAYLLDLDPPEPNRKIRYRKAWGSAALAGLLLIAPSVISNVIFDWLPMIDGITKSFYTWTARNPEPVFVGLDNFIHVLTDTAFISSIRNMAFFLGANLLLMFPTIVCCVVLFRIKNTKLQYLYRVLLCLPMVVPGLIFTLMWIFILGYDFGAVNTLLESMGLKRIMFLGDPALIKWTIIMTGIPFVSANTALIYLGGLNGIGDSVWEAAELDGVGPVRKFTAIEFPLMIGQFKLNLVGVLGASITAYSTQLVFYNGSVHDGIMTPGLLMYFKAFPNTGAPDYGYAYALGLILFAVSLSISLVSMKLIKTRE